MLHKEEIILLTNEFVLCRFTCMVPSWLLLGLVLPALVFCWRDTLRKLGLDLNCVEKTNGLL
jgi:hypothetical protein